MSVAASVKGIRVTRQGVRGFGGYIVERTDPRGGAYYWIGYAPGEHELDEESDLARRAHGYISVTPLHLDLTHEATRRKLARAIRRRPEQDAGAMNVPAMQRLIAELRQSGITDEKVLAAIGAVDRERFVPAPFAERAWENTALPISFGQTISQPLVVASMTEALRVGPRMKVLEIGTGSGYQAAVLAKLARRVYSIERFKPLSKEAERLLIELGIYNVVCDVGDGSKGWPGQAPFDRIIVTAAAEERPQALIDQLAVGGILIVPVGRDPTTPGGRAHRQERERPAARHPDAGPLRAAGDRRAAGAGTGLSVLPDCGPPGPLMIMIGPEDRGPATCSTRRTRRACGWGEGRAGRGGRARPARGRRCRARRTSRSRRPPRSRGGSRANRRRPIWPRRSPRS